MRKKERIHFSERDASLFRYLHAHKAAKVDQMERDIFQLYNRKTALLEASKIRTTRIYRFPLRE